MNLNFIIDILAVTVEFWYVLLIVIGLLFLAFVMLIQIPKMRQRIYFIKRDRERLIGILQSAKDGYFAFIHPDIRIHDPRKSIKEKCSRRLAVALNLEKGTEASFEDVLKCFYKDDAKKIGKYVELLRQDGSAFEDKFSLKSAESRHFLLYGCRINGFAGNVFCDMVWFRDLSEIADTINDLKSESEKFKQQILQLRDLIDNLPYPLWLRDKDLNLRIINKKYAELAGNANLEEILLQNIELLNATGESISQNLALSAIAANKPKKQNQSMVKNGQRLALEVCETPFIAEENLNNLWTAGMAVNISELDELKRNIKQNQNSQLQVLSTLETPIAIFNEKTLLSFYNDAFATLWNLDKSWLSTKPNYSAFLDAARENRTLPEMSNYTTYKEEEIKAFLTVVEAKKDMLHLPNGKIIRRLRAPYSVGGLLFAFEDISDRIAQEEAYNALLSLQKETLDNLFDGILIFAQDGRLVFFNEPFLKLWQFTENEVQKGFSIMQVVDLQRKFFNKIDNWDSLKEEILNHILNPTTKVFSLKTDSKAEILVMSTQLSDGSIMVTYKT